MVYMITCPHVFTYNTCFKEYNVFLWGTGFAKIYIFPIHSHEWMSRGKPRFTDDLHVKITREQKNFLKEMFGEGDRIGRFVRNCIDAYRISIDIDKLNIPFPELERRLAAFGPEYKNLKERVDALYAERLIADKPVHT